MKFLDDISCAAWCDERGYRTRRTMYGLHEPVLREDVPFTDLAYPDDSGHKVALSKEIVHWSQSFESCLIWVREFGVWPSSEHRPLYDRFREALGDTGGLGSASGHLVERSDRDDAISVVALSLLFFWDVYVLPPTPGLVFFASHDEYAGFFISAGNALPDAFAPWLPDAPT
jgi:hypothetical protein